MDKNTISIVVPARDEEASLERAVNVMLPPIKRHFSDFEIFIYDDGSTDRTGEIADTLAAQYDSISAFHNNPAICLGGVVNEGLKRASMEYFMYIDGKGATTAEALDRIFEKRREADLVIPYPMNQGERSAGRRLLSNIFVAILNITFGLDLHYFNHLLLCRTETARRADVQTASYAFQAERVIKLIGSGCSYVEIGVEDRYDLPGRRTKAFKFGNVIGVFSFYFRVLRDVRSLKGQK